MKKSVPVGELKFGMFVAELDRPWTDTPFLFQGFVLESQKQLDTLKQYCATVLVDAERSQLPAAPHTGTTRYAETASVEQEAGRARALYRNSRTMMRDVLSSARIGRTLDAKQLKSAVTTMTESVLRNPDAMLLLSQLRKKGEYNESHALDVSIYMITFGRFLELEPGQIEFLGYLGLLQDVGKLRLPRELLEKRGRLSAEEFELAKLHVEYSAEILRATPGLPDNLARAAAPRAARWQRLSGQTARQRDREIGLDCRDRRHLRRHDRTPALCGPGVAVGGDQHAVQMARHLLRCPPGGAVHPLHRHLPGRQPRAPE